MNKGFFAILLLAVLLLPMYGGLRRIRRLPPPGRDRQAENAPTQCD